MSKARQRQPKRKVMTDEDVADLERKSKRYPKPVPQKAGMYIRIAAKGSSQPHVYAAVARDPTGRQVWATLGDTNKFPSIALAEAAADEAIRRIKQGLPAREPPPPPEVKPDSVADVAATWLVRYVRTKEMRTADEMERILNRYILPRWSALPFATIKRSKFNELLNEIEDAHGAHMADNVAAVLRSIGTWYRDVGDDYVSPFSGVKKRVPEHKRSRDRVLDDAEIAAVWKAAETPDAGAYGSLLRLLLLTAQRLSVVVGMKWTDIENGVWTIRKNHPREKENGGRIKLPRMALDIVKAMPKFIDDDDIFAGHRSYGFTDLKKRFDEHCGVKNWRTHDLRRTARTLMSRVKVDRTTAERVLGHRIGSKIEQTYDRFAYEKEKSAALRKLAAQITKIVHPPTPKPKRKRQSKRDNVVPLRAAS